MLPNLKKSLELRREFKNILENLMSLNSRSLTLGAFAALAMTSCSLPPREAWRQIQRDGLIPFVATQLDRAPSPATPSKNQMVAQKKQAPAASAVASSGSAGGLIGPPSTAANNTPSPAMIDSQKIPAAQAVPGLTGYVRTPFTNPPRLVDVRGMAPGSKVVCPFTNKPFLVPSATSAAAPTKVAVAPVEPKPAPKIEAPTLSPTLPAPSGPTAALKSPTPTPAPTPSVQPKPQVANNPPSSTPAPQPKADGQEIPYGTPISGRPGFVNSPFAAKHQLVDVTGLPVGMEVKCPYTGKLFRVPPQDQAQGKLPVQNTASPEKK